MCTRLLFRRDFDTLQYLCGSAYNGLPSWVVDNITTSLLLPTACIALLIVAFCALKGDGVSFAPVCVFAIQTVPFSLLGIGIMRLMMFGNVSLCVLAGLIASPDVWRVVLELLPSKNTGRTSC